MIVFSFWVVLRAVSVRGVDEALVAINENILKQLVKVTTTACMRRQMEELRQQGSDCCLPLLCFTFSFLPGKAELEGIYRSVYVMRLQG